MISKMSHKISQNLKGALGEIFVKKTFEEFELIEPLELIKEFENPPKVKVVYPEGMEYIDYRSKECMLWDNKRYNKATEKYGTATLPDFLIRGTKILIEVKTGKYAKLEKNQLKEFPFILKKGFRIFIIRPKLLIEKRKIEVIDFYCIEFLGRNERMKITLDAIKQLIKKQIKN